MSLAHSEQRPVSTLEDKQKSVLLTVFHQDISSGKLLTMQKSTAEFDATTCPETLLWCRPGEKDRQLYLVKNKQHASAGTDTTSRRGRRWWCSILVVVWARIRHMWQVLLCKEVLLFSWQPEALPSQHRFIGYCYSKDSIVFLYLKYPWQPEALPLHHGFIGYWYAEDSIVFLNLKYPWQPEA